MPPSRIPPMYPFVPSSQPQFSGSSGAITFHCQSNQSLGECSTKLLSPAAMPQRISLQNMAEARWQSCGESGGTSGPL